MTVNMNTRLAASVAVVAALASCASPPPGPSSAAPTSPAAPAPAVAAPSVEAPSAAEVAPAPAPAPAPAETARAKATPAVDERPAGWQACGWGGGGLYWSCVFDPADADTIYLGGDVVGTYKSTDAGKRFRFITKGLGNFAVHSLAAAKSAPGTLYALTKDGVSRSRDGGENWTHLAVTGHDGLGIKLHRPLSVRAVAVDPTDARTVYVGGHAGGLWKTIDGGETWRHLEYLSRSAGAAAPAFAGKGSLALSFDAKRGDWKAHGRAEKHFGGAGRDLSAYARITARVMAPKGAPRLQYQLVVQTGEKWLWQDGPFVDGRSGAWTPVALDLAGKKDLDATRALYVVIRCPEAAYRGRVYVDAVTLHRAGGESEVLADWETPGDASGWSFGKRYENTKLVTGVAQSQASNVKVSASAVSSVAVSRTDPRIVMIASSSHGLYRSSDAGASWSRVGEPAKASCIAFAPSDGKIAYASFWDEKVARSADGGLTWTKCDASAFEAKRSIRQVVVHPTDPNRAWCIGNIGWGGRVYRSTDGGASWKDCTKTTRDLAANPTLPREPGGKMSKVTNIAVSPMNPDRLYISANWRCFLSDDGGSTWQERIAGADITCFTDIRFCGGTVYVTAMDEGLLCSDDRGATWRQLFPLRWARTGSGHQWRCLVRDVDGHRRIVSTLSPWDDNEHPNRVLVSDDGGSSFVNGYAGLPDYRPRPNTMWGQGYPRALAADPSDPNTLYLGIDGAPEKGREGGGVFKSTDGGRSWRRLASQPASRRMFYGLAVDPTDRARIYWGACGERGGLHRTSDGGASWEHVFDKETWVFNVEVAPSGAVYCPGKNLWRSTDAGATWTKITSFSGMQITGLAIDPRDERRIWLSRVTWGEAPVGGVWRTTDGGATWEDITAALPNPKPLVLRYDPDARELWAGGPGLFRIAQ